MNLRNVDRKPPLGIHAPWLGLWRNARLLHDLIKRDIVGRYRGAMGGVLWAFLSPLMMLAIYSFVFGLIFNSRWTSQETGDIHFSIVLFIGLIFSNFLADCINRAPGLIVSNANYVKKVVFPVEILPPVAVGAALFHAMISVLVLFLFMLLSGTAIASTAIFLPIMFLLFLPAVLGFSWGLAALGVYLRDMQQFVGVLAMAMMFLAPIFYPRTMLPDEYQGVMAFNPLTFIVESSRGLILWGQMPDGVGMLVYGVVSLFIGWMGWLVFQLTRRGFADVI